MLYERELNTAERAARAAGAVLIERRGRLLEIREKADRSLVTDADLAADGAILEVIAAAFPEDGILSEEADVTEGRSGRQWIVDPLDGTTNYSRGLPFFAVSIALWEAERPLAGVVYLPVLDELFAATCHTPSTLNGVEIQVSDTDTVKQSMINVYFDRHSRLEAGLDVLRRVALRCEGRVKNLGSTASVLCYVASGRLDGYVRNTTKLWDFAAAALVLEQAGGRVSDFGEAPLRGSGQSLLATNGQVHEELARIVRAEEP